LENIEIKWDWDGMGLGWGGWMRIADGMIIAHLLDELEDGKSGFVRFRSLNNQCPSSDLSTSSFLPESYLLTMLIAVRIQKMIL